MEEPENRLEELYTSLCSKITSELAEKGYIFTEDLDDYIKKRLEEKGIQTHKIINDIRLGRASNDELQEYFDTEKRIMNEYYEKKNKLTDVSCSGKLIFIYRANEVIFSIVKDILMGEINGEMMEYEISSGKRIRLDSNNGVAIQVAYDPKTSMVHINIHQKKNLEK
ncbi:hypothetical protein [Metallosphaera hakonensis]|uniref:Uncharacterized protein n=1 Tax=Metallosphaera hakonensis JCM 8857 = DSM 7519 TaxID=1293036 RepID=A0A2U9IQT2_9CREN|nr:hypothetical protein [Metallosphaera hakonensis]AWR98380.1 hypothetical protein DFR87_00145 [Metallosphaera hakonensis JCM 8857 = DSM 7519]